MRAFSVLAVVGFHAFPGWVKGGFVGVDVFFAISGFLISRLLFAQLEGGVFRFSSFYARRIRRIFPALLLVLAACLAFGWVVLFADEYALLGKHVAAGAAFVSNALLWQEAGYFDAAAAVKPLLHLWSLGIEEQFYLAWPLLLWGAWRAGVNVLLLAGFLAAGSLGLTVLWPDDVAVFYSPLTRFWELLAGGMLAWGGVYRKGPLLPAKAGHVLSFAGAGLVVYAMFASGTPRGLAGVAAVGAALLLAAGGDAWVNRRLLSSRGAVWLGLISYPLYLWHWPLLSFATIMEGGEPGWDVRMGAVALSLVLAWLTYWFVERPVRIGGIRVAWLVAFMLAMGGSGYALYQYGGVPQRMKQHSEEEAQFVVPAYATNRAPCKGLFKKRSNSCLVADGVDSFDGLNVFIMGDSHATAVSVGLIREKDLRFAAIGLWGCLPLIGVERYSIGKPYHCMPRLETILNVIKGHDMSQAVLVYVARYAAYVEGDWFEGAGEPPGNTHIQPYGPLLPVLPEMYPQVFADGMNKTLAQLSGRFKRVIVLHQVPELPFSPKACMDRLFGLHMPNCVFPKAEVMARQKKYREKLAEVVAPFSNVTVYDPIDLFCDAQNCYALRNGVMLYRDHDHVSLAGANAIIRALRDEGFF
ncbi:MAG: acyltransferase [Rickettsiales bacterium]|nr:acyltransferase [Rickettsiales bacterium]